MVILRRHTLQWPLINNLEIPKKEKAELVKNAGREYAKLWVTAIDATKTLYMHLLLCHLPQQISELPVDPWYYQTQGLEHLNKIRKKLAKGTNHHIPGNQASVMVGEYEYKKKNGTIVKVKAAEKPRFTGPCMTYQILKLHVLHDHVQTAMAKQQGSQAQAKQQQKVVNKKLKEKRAWLAKMES